VKRVCVYNELSINPLLPQLLLLRSWHEVGANEKLMTSFTPSLTLMEEYGEERALVKPFI
jgi:hypothetical protein